MFTMGQRLGLGKRCGSRGREARQRGPIITIQRPIRTTTLQSILSHKENVVQKSGGAEPLPKLSLDLPLTRPAVLANPQLRMLVLDLLQ